MGREWRIRCWVGAMVFDTQAMIDGLLIRRKDDPVKKESFVTGL
jgi:hypothetical protein